MQKKVKHVLGKPALSKTDEFLKKIRTGGNGHIRSKTFYCNLFCFRNGNFGHEFPEKPLKNVHCKNGAGATGLQKNCNILFRKRGGGGAFIFAEP